MSVRPVPALEHQGHDGTETMMASALPLQQAVCDPPLLTTVYDRAAGIVRVTSRGFWSIAFIDAHFDELEGVIQAIHANAETAFVIVDLTGAAVQSPEVAKRIRTHIHRIYREDDRVAMVVQSSLLKSQMRRVAWNLDLGLFISPSAAETWLTAYR